MYYRIFIYNRDFLNGLRMRRRFYVEDIRLYRMRLVFVFKRGVNFLYLEVKYVVVCGILILFDGVYMIRWGRFFGCYLL